MTDWMSSAGGSVPHNAVAGGNDVGGETIYVGRAPVEGDMIPGKIVPSHGCCYVAYGGQEHRREEYEYLVSPSYGSLTWKRANEGQIPQGAIPAGKTESGEPLFVGRAYYNGSWVIGKVQQSHMVLYVPFDGQEVGIGEYEVLCVVY